MGRYSLVVTGQGMAVVRMFHFRIPASASGRALRFALLARDWRATPSRGTDHVTIARSIGFPVTWLTFAL